MANTLTFASQTLTDANIFGGINFLHDLNTGEEFSIGNTASASVKFVTDTQLPLYTKDSTNGTFTWTQDDTPRGRFYITEVIKESGRYNVTAYDAMSLLETNISALSLTLPVTVSAAASAIAAYIGCTVSGTINNGSLEADTLDADLSIRALLGYVAEASGCSVKIDADDHICFMYYEDSEITVTASDYISLNVADYTCAAIDNVTIFNSEGEIQASYGSGSNSLYIGQNPFLEEATNTNAQTILSQVSGFVYAPLTCEMFTENGLEVGTIATFGSTSTLVMHIESSESGATASSVGSDSRADYNKSIVVIANEARAIAIDTQSVASAAAGLLSDMQAAASAAGTTLEGIYADAESALASATQASEDAQTASESASSAVSSANIALDQLGIVENVVGVLDLLSKHGNYQVTQDLQVIPDKWYFTRSGTAPNYEYSVVSNPTAIEYELTSDVAIDPDKTYYTRSGSGTEEDPYVYTPVDDPDVSEIGTYYECIYYELVGIDEAIQNYVSSQLVVDDDGLWLKTVGVQSKVLLSAEDGVVLYGTDGTVVGKYGATAQIGDANGFHIEMNGTELGFYQGQNKVAYISNQQLYITQSVVLEQMDLGRTVLDGGLGQWSWKVHKNANGQNNLNLKWIG